ncbi:MAG: hypothetical protein GX813_00245 [Erysipelotrichia bacterium]|nr:hypothetical protein [Erysipelotrichia bacterium]
MTLSKVSFKDLSAMTERVARRYFLARKVAQLKADRLISEQLQEVSDTTCDIYLTKVLEAFETLTEKERNLINNEFFFQSYQGWWKTIYTTSTFYRYKKLAMLHFLEAFYHV